MTKAFEIALKEYGTKGIMGVGESPQVLNYFAEIGHSWVKDDDTAWCAAFLNWCLKKAGATFTGSLLARSFLNFGTNTKTPTLGDIVVLWRVSPTSGFGHVGFFISETADTIFILAGNQDNQVNIKEFPKTKLLGYRTNYGS